MDDEFARFQAELASLEPAAAGKPAAVGPAAKLSSPAAASGAGAGTGTGAGVAAPTPAPPPRPAGAAPALPAAKPAASAAAKSLAYRLAAAKAAAAVAAPALAEAGLSAAAVGTPGVGLGVPGVPAATGAAAAGRPAAGTAAPGVPFQQPAAAPAPKARDPSKKLYRVAAGKVWRDKTLNDWPENDYRLFVGDLGNEVTDDILAGAFQKYTSFAKARVIRDKYTHKSKGFGFVSFLDAIDAARALREMNGKYVGNRPVKIKKGKWQDRDLRVVQKKQRKKKKMQKMLSKSIFD